MARDSTDGESEAGRRLRAAGLRPTRQRIALAALLLDGRCRHVTAEDVRAEARAADIAVSLATVYNALNQFTAAGLLREVTVEPGRSYFDTNVSEHHHFLIESSGTLVDVAAGALRIDGMPELPPGTALHRVDVVIRVRPKGAPGA